MAIVLSLLLGAALGASAVYGWLNDRIESYRLRNQDLRNQLNDMQLAFGDRLHKNLTQQRFDYESKISLLEAQLFRAKFRRSSVAQTASLPPETKAS
ncbi:MAG: hypothetical protein HC824_12475 [Synechococcales cyanobacterium RM1_1_8]|nr:hypothetical protein [Synechococcales cyanobacterium RM1_1_8]